LDSGSKGRDKEKQKIELKGVYEDNLPWIAGVKVEIKKSKRYGDH
jgi:hypothetical protein